MKPIAILCNGLSLAEHAKRGHLDNIPCETLGLNRSWELHEATHHLMVDPAQWSFYSELRGVDAAGNIPNLYTSTNGPTGAHQIRILGSRVVDSEEVRFSWHPFELGAWLCGSVTWVALQMAVAWKCNPIFFLGLDLQGGIVDGKSYGKFWGGRWPDSAEARQRELFGYARGLLGNSGIELVNVVIDPKDSKLEALPKRSFEDAFHGISLPIRGDGNCTINSMTRMP